MRKRLFYFKNGNLVQDTDQIIYKDGRMYFKVLKYDLIKCSKSFIIISKDEFQKNLICSIKPYPANFIYKFKTANEFLFSINSKDIYFYENHPIKLLNLLKDITNAI